MVERNGSLARQQSHVYKGNQSQGTLELGNKEREREQERGRESEGGRTEAS